MTVKPEDWSSGFFPGSLWFLYIYCGSNSWKKTAVDYPNRLDGIHFRPDGTAYHVVDYDPETGAIRAIHANQGADVRTAWARGQAWAIYGFIMMHRKTKKAEYLDKAVAVAEVVMAHPNLPSDKVPYWDFGAAAGESTPRDASSAAVMGSALVELIQLAGGEKGAKFLDFARAQMLGLSTPAYLAEPGTNRGFLLAHSAGHLPGKSEINVPLNYADYYYLEALLRYRALVTNKDRPSFGAMR